MGRAATGPRPSPGAARDAGERRREREEVTTPSPRATCSVWLATSTARSPRPTSLGRSSSTNSSYSCGASPGAAASAERRARATRRRSLRSERSNHHLAPPRGRAERVKSGAWTRSWRGCPSVGRASTPPPRNQATGADGCGEGWALKPLCSGLLWGFAVFGRRVGMSRLSRFNPFFCGPSCSPNRLAKTRWARCPPCPCCRAVRFREGRTMGAREAALEHSGGDQTESARSFRLAPSETQNYLRGCSPSFATRAARTSSRRITDAVTPRRFASAWSFDISWSSSRTR